MDRFKFRAWDSLDKKWVSDSFIDQCFLNMNGELWWHSHAGWEKLNNRWAPVHCTGLKDKNGKLIYEGDILKIVSTHFYRPFGENPKQRLKYDEPKIRYEEVIYNEKKAKFYFDILSMHGCEKHEIIGNKFENPELLEET